MVQSSAATDISRIDPIQELIEQYHSHSFDGMLKLAQIESGHGVYNQQIRSFMRGCNWLRAPILGLPAIHTGVTFITRPTINLSTENIGPIPEFTPLNTMNPNTLGFGIRMILDLWRSRRYANQVANSPYLNSLNPFNMALSNGCLSVSGLPDYNITTTETNKGFFGETQTYATGFDQFMGTTELLLTFQDIPNNAIKNIFTFWFLCMVHLYFGTITAYQEDIDDRVIPYTCSIYRFVLDATGRYIIGAAKATGCFPKAVPIGEMFNVNEGQWWANGVSKFTIPFACNNIQYNNPYIFLDFNQLVADETANQIQHGIDIYQATKQNPEIPIANNFSESIPYINFPSHGKGVELTYRMLSQSSSGENNGS